MSDYPSRENIGFVSTGNPEQDEQILSDFIRHEKRIVEGICPNGCGPLKVISHSEQECLACGFHHETVEWRVK